MLVVRHKLAQLPLLAALLCACASEVEPAFAEVLPTQGMDMNLNGRLTSGESMPLATAEADGGVAHPAPEAAAGTAGTSPVWRSMFRVPEEAGKVLIAACPTPDYDGSIVTRADCGYWVIETFDLDTQQLLFYSDSRESGAVCGTRVPIGTRVSARVRWGNEDCTLLHWRSGFGVSQGASCECEQSSDPVCNFNASHDSYCGAVLTKKPAAL